MESFDLISKLLEGRVVIGKKEEVAPDLFIIPVYKLKITIFNLNADMKNNNSSGDTSSLTASPICLLKIQNSNVDIITFENTNTKDCILDIIPNVLSNFDVNSLLKNIKI